jgi:hypothetical protein
MPSEETEKKATHELKDLEVYQIDIVGQPATGERFVQIRSADGGGEQRPPRRSVRAKSVEPSEGKIAETGSGGPNYVNINVHRGGVVNLKTGNDSVDRQVPSADASTEQKRKAQKARSQKYGIEALEGKGEKLTYPSGKATRENLYGDPVNLGFPFASDDNKLDVKLANNARTRFKQFADRYEKNKSKKTVHNRIVEAQLKAGASPGFDPDDELDKMLSADLKKKLQKPVERTVDDNTNETLEKNEMSKLDEVIKKVDRLSTAFDRVTESGIFKDILEDKDPDKKEDEKADGEKPDEPEDEVSQDQEEASVAASNKASEQVASEDTTPTETPSEAAPAASSEPLATETQPAPAVEEVGQLTAVVERLSGLTEKMGEQIEKVAKSVDGLGKRVDSVERSLKIGGNTNPQDETESVERKGKKKSLFAGIIN